MTDSRWVGPFDTHYNDACEECGTVTKLQKLVREHRNQDDPRHDEQYLCANCVRQRRLVVPPQAVRAAADLTFRDRLPGTEDDFIRELARRREAAGMLGLPPAADLDLVRWPDGKHRVARAGPGLAALLGTTDDALLGVDVVTLTGHPASGAGLTIAAKMESDPPTETEAYSMTWVRHWQTREVFWLYMRWTPALTPHGRGVRIEAWPAAPPDADLVDAVPVPIKPEQVAPYVQPHADVIVDAGRIVHEVAPHFTELYGWTEAHLVGHHIRTLQGREHQTETPERIKAFEEGVLGPLQRGEFDTPERRGEVPVKGWIFDVSGQRREPHSIITHLGEGWLRFRFTRL